jgi:hypothetical protein
MLSFPRNMWTRCEPLISRKHYVFCSGIEKIKETFLFKVALIYCALLNTSNFVGLSLMKQHDRRYKGKCRYSNRYSYSWHLASPPPSDLFPFIFSLSVVKIDFIETAY